MIRELLLRHTYEGWYVIIQQGLPGRMRDELKRYGPLRHKPQARRLHELQWRYFFGQQCDVIVEEYRRSEQVYEKASVTFPKCPTS